MVTKLKRAEEPPFKNIKAIYDEPFRATFFKQGIVDDAMKGKGPRLFGKTKDIRKKHIYMRACISDLTARKNELVKKHAGEEEILAVERELAQTEQKMRALIEKKMSADSAVGKKLKEIAVDKVMHAEEMKPGFLAARKVLWMLERNIPVTPDNIGRSRTDLFDARKGADEYVLKLSRDRRRVTLIWQPVGEGTYFADEGRVISAYADAEGAVVRIKDATGRNGLAPIYSLETSLVFNRDGMMLRYDDGNCEFLRFTKRVDQRAFERQILEAEARLREEAVKVYDQIARGVDEPVLATRKARKK